MRVQGIRERITTPTPRRSKTGRMGWGTGGFSMYKNMTEILKDGQVGDFTLSRFTVGDNDFYAHIRCGISNGTYMQLKHKGEIVMSDTDMEKRTNKEFLRNAHGDVLIGGLGIGMIVLAVQDEPEVNSITILEKNQEVIDLVGSQLPLNDKVKIIHSDVFEWKPEKGKKYNCIYMDIWNYINRDVYKREMLPLTRKYAHYLVSADIDPRRYNGCWCKRQAKNGERI